MEQVVAPVASAAQHAPVGGGGGVQVVEAHVEFTPRQCPCAAAQSASDSTEQVVAPVASAAQHAPVGGGGGVQVVAPHVLFGPRYNPWALKQAAAVTTEQVGPEPVAPGTQHAPVGAVCADAPDAATRQHVVPARTKLFNRRQTFMSDLLDSRHGDIHTCGRTESNDRANHRSGAHATSYTNPGHDLPGPRNKLICHVRHHRANQPSDTVPEQHLLFLPNTTRFYLLNALVPHNPRSNVPTLQVAKVGRERTLSDGLGKPKSDCLGHKTRSICAVHVRPSPPAAPPAASSTTS